MHRAARAFLALPLLALLSGPGFAADPIDPLLSRFSMRASGAEAEDALRARRLCGEASQALYDREAPAIVERGSVSWSQPDAFEARSSVTWSHPEQGRVVGPVSCRVERSEGALAIVGFDAGPWAPI